MCTRTATIIVLTLVLAGAAPSRADDHTWNVDSGDWSAAGSWNPAGPPDSTDNAVMDRGGGGIVTLDNNYSINNVTISGSGTWIFVNTNNTLTIAGTFQYGSSSTASGASNILAGAGNLVVTNGQLTLWNTNRYNLTTINGGTLLTRVNGALGTNTVAVNTNGAFYQGVVDMTGINTNFVFNGGSWWTIAETPWNFTNDANIVINSAGMIYRGGYGISGNEGQITRFTGLISGSGKLTKDKHAGGESSRLCLVNGSNTFAGGLDINVGSLEVRGDGALSTGLVTVKSNATLRLLVPQTQAKAPNILVQSGGSMYIDRPESGPVDNSVYANVTNNGGTILGATGYGGSFVLAGTNTLTADSFYNQGGKSDVTLEITARIGESGGSYKVMRNAGTANKPVILGNSSNDYSGGTECRQGIISFSVPGAQGLGSIVVASNAMFEFDTAANQDWTITNGLAGVGTNKIEDGTYTLTVAGRTVSPGANTGTVGTNSTGNLIVLGSLAFGKAGSEFSQLNIEIAGTNNVAGADYDRLAVSSNCTGLGNATLIVVVSTNLNPCSSVIGTQVFDVVTCSSDLSGLAFNSVIWSNNWHGRVEYSNGYVRLSGLSPDIGGTMYEIDSESPTNTTLTPPFVETFEDIALGYLHGTNNWQASPTNSAVVNANVVYGGSRAVRLGLGGMWHGFDDSTATNVWIDWYARCSPRTTNPTNLSPNATAALYLNTDGNIVAYSNNIWVTFGNVTVATDTWARYTLNLDYVSSNWAIYVADNVPNRLATPVATNLKFAATGTNTYLRSFKAANQ